MALPQNNAARFAGPDMIQDSHHLSGIPQVQDDADQFGQQSEQGQSDRRRKGAKNRNVDQFEYHNPRQHS